MIAMTAIALSGCASSDAGTTSESAPATPDSSATAVIESVSGQGSTEFPGVEFPIPDDAQSVVVDFECVGGGNYSVELGDSMMLGQTPLSGPCDGTAQLSWPVTERTGPTLHVVVSDGARWVATPRFSAAEFDHDTALKTDCEQFSDVFSALMNADSGYTHHGAFDAAEWASRVDQAATDLGTLAASAQSTLGGAFARLQTIVTASSRTVGAVLTETARGPIDEISRACEINHTPLILKAEFGG